MMTPKLSHSVPCSLGKKNKFTKRILIIQLVGEWTN
jgi:hypothetical protein